MTMLLENFVKALPMWLALSPKREKLQDLLVLPYSYDTI